MNNFLIVPMNEHEKPYFISQVNNKLSDEHDQGKVKIFEIEDPGEDTTIMEVSISGESHEIENRH